MRATRRILITLVLPLMLLALWFIPAAGHIVAPLDIGEAFSLHWTQDGDETGDQLGYAVGTAGDVNGDGYSDVIVGAPYDVYTSSEKVGVAYVFHGSGGGLDENAIPDWTAAGTKGSFFGGAVSTAGDVNNDGYDDVIVGARYHKKPSETGSFGGVFAFYGSHSGLAETPGWSLIGEQKDSELGVAVGAAGDVNGDDYDDVIVGAIGYSNAETREGMIYVFFGASSGLTTTHVFTVESNQSNALFGFSVRTAGDVNNDTYDDIIVGAPEYDIPGIPDAGAAFVYYGAAGGINPTPTVLYGDQSDARYADAVSTAGDINGDGYDDIIVGAPSYNHNGLDGAGTAFIYLGSPTGVITTPHRQLFKGDIGAQFGADVGTVGDTSNNDGYDDVIIGAPYYTFDQSDEGAVWVYPGSPLGLNTSFIWRGEGNKADATFGYAAGSAGDVNDDGFVDIIVGAPEYRIEEIKRGRAFVYLGTGDNTIIYNSIYLPLVLRNSP